MERVNKMLNKEDINTLYKAKVILQGYNKHGIVEKYNIVLDKIIKKDKLIKKNRKGKKKNENK